MTVRTADYWVDCLLFWLVLSDAPARFSTSLFGIGELFTNVLSSGLPLPAPGLSGSLFLSGLRGLGSGCAAERRLGEVVVRISLQSLPRIGRFLRLGWRGLLQPAVIHCGSDCGISILHGKISRIDITFFFKVYICEHLLHFTLDFRA